MEVNGKSHSDAPQSETDRFEKEREERLKRVLRGIRDEHPNRPDIARLIIIFVLHEIKGYKVGSAALAEHGIDTEDKLSLALEEVWKMLTLEDEGLAPPKREEEHGS